MGPVDARARWRPLLLAVLAGMLLAALGGATPAFAAGSWWHLNSTAAPTNLEPNGEGEVVASAADFGYEAVTATEAHPIVISDRLPAGLKLLEVVGYRSPEVAGRPTRAPGVLTCTDEGPEEGPSVSCEVPGTILPYEGMEIVMKVKVTAAAEGTLSNEVRVEGGESQTQRASLARALDVRSGGTPFGVEKYELVPENEDGSVDTQAGSHPFQLTTDLNFNQSIEHYESDSGEKLIRPVSPALVRNLHFILPPGMLGNVNVVPQCSSVDFATILVGDINLCPAETAVGVARVMIDEPDNAATVDESVPVFNLAPAADEPARFGIEVEKVPVILNTAVLTGKGYAVEVSTTNTTQVASLLSTQVTFWGVPGDPRHNQSRGWECLVGGHWETGAEAPKPCLPSKEAQPSAFLTLPTSCEQAPSTEVSGESWPHGRGKEASPLGGATKFTFPFRFSGCNVLAFDPSIGVEPGTQSASTPSGLTVKVRVPQESTLSATGLGEADIKDTTVALPQGVQASPGAADGLLACSSEQAGFTGSFESSPGLINERQNEEFSPGAATCPEASKIGTVNIRTPLLKGELDGGVYLASQDTSPFRSPLVLYLIAEEKTSGVRVKLAGEVQINQATGQLTTTFSQTPPVPFDELTLNLFEGPRASQATPPFCGNYTTTSSFTPWSGGAPTTPSASFAIAFGPGGGPCPTSPLPLAPSFEAGSTNTQAGAFSPFTLTIDRPDGDQALTGLEVHLPKGAAAMLSSVTPCPEPPLGQEWACGPESEIGQSTASSGLGGDPYTLGGRVYLTSGYDGAPFGVLDQTEARAGPFNLGMVDVRSRINVDPNTAAATITVDPGPRGEGLPTMLKGVPVQLKRINVTVDREHFEFNPTNCTPLAVTATLSGSEGASTPESAPFEASNCANLPFSPKLTAEAAGHGSKADGTRFVVKVTSGPGQANISKTFLTIPAKLPARLSTIQQACIAATFEANPATCPEGSNIGMAIAHTPVLRSPLVGPAYLVSYGSAAFPDVEFVLQGEGILLLLDGKTDIKKGVTYSRFESVPDAPVSMFETVLPAGPHSALTAAVAESAKFSLCGTSLSMPTEITGQNGALIKTTTKVAITGCASAKKKSDALAKALAACKKQYAHSKKKRAACEARARKKYPGKTAGKAKKAKKAGARGAIRAPAAKRASSRGRESDR